MLESTQSALFRAGRGARRGGRAPCPHSSSRPPAHVQHRVAWLPPDTESSHLFFWENSLPYPTSQLPSIQSGNMSHIKRSETVSSFIYLFPGRTTRDAPLGLSSANTHYIRHTHCGPHRCPRQTCGTFVSGLGVPCRHPAQPPWCRTKTLLVRQVLTGCHRHSG